MTKIKDDTRVHHRVLAEQPAEEPVAEVKPKATRSKAGDTKKAPKSKRRS